MYGEALAYDLSKNRLSAEVVRVEPEDLDAELEGFDPQLVVCNEATDEVRSLSPSWVVLSYPRAVEADVCLGGHRSTIEDVRVEDVLAVMDEAERLCAEPT
jgi:hypothetical protein